MFCYWCDETIEDKPVHLYGPNYIHEECKKDWAKFNQESEELAIRLYERDVEIGGRDKE